MRVGIIEGVYMYMQMYIYTGIRGFVFELYNIGLGFLSLELGAFEPRYGVCSAVM